MLLQEHLAIASVPPQQWGELYEQAEALRTGTIFKELDLPFFAAKSQEITGKINPACSQEDRDRELLLLQIQQISFVLDDVRLYLDTHPQDQQGVAFLKKFLPERKNLLKEFAKKYYPLTWDCMLERYEAEPDTSCYCWEKGPVPWEGACV